MIDRHSQRIAAPAIAQANEDPFLVNAIVQHLIAAGEIDPGDLQYLERIADKWIAIARQNRATGQR